MKSLRFAFVALLSVVLAGCGLWDGGGGGTSGGGDGPVAVVTGLDGVKLTIPSGAVSQDTTHRIASDSDGAPSTAGLTLLTPVYAVTPHGQAFGEDALIEIPYDQSQVPPGTVPFLLRADAGGQWQAFGDARLANGAAKTDISSLSYYAIAVCAQDISSPGDCPFNSQLTLELLDSSGIAIPVQFNSLGQALPVITVDQSTTLNFRATWTRPPNTDRTDSILLSLNGGGQLQTVPSQQVPPFNEVTELNFNVLMDPATVSGASGPNGKIVRMRASVWSSYLAFVGPPTGFENIQWEMLTEIAVRVRHSGPQPAITREPANQSATEGQTATFSVAASGSGLTYQWQRSNDNGVNFSNIGGATAASCTTAATALSDNGALFQVQVCQAAACIYSGAAGLTVTSSASATLPAFTLQPASIAVLAGQTANLTAVAAGTPAPSVQWYEFDGFLGIPVGTPCGGSGTSTACTYTTPVLALADSGSRFYAGAGNSAGSAQSNTVTVTVTNAAVAPAITTQPSDITVSVGNEATFRVAASGTAPLSYQWSKNGVNIRGANGTSYRVRNAQPADNGAAFSVEVRNSAGRVTSDNAILTVTAASSGPLDTTFGTGGKVTTAFGPSPDEAHSVAIQSDGKIVVAGYSFNGTFNNFALARYATNGSLDTTFGTGGKVTTAFGTDTNDRSWSVAIQSDGKIVAAGESAGFFALARYNADGSLDSSFGTGGKVKVTTVNGLAVGVAIQSDGKIVAAGDTFNVADYDFMLIRYNADGSLDAAFGTGGIVTTATGTGTNDSALSVAIQADGKIVAAGRSGSLDDHDFALVRYNTDGSLDATFGTGGKATTPIGTDDWANSVVIQPDGKIVAAGYTGFLNTDFALARYNTDGSLDTTFGTGGIATTAIGIHSYAKGVAVQSDGKILAAGDSTNGAGDSDFVLIRYNAGGSPDTTFGTGGIVTTAIGTDTVDNARSVAIQSPVLPTAGVPQGAHFLREWGGPPPSSIAKRSLETGSERIPGRVAARGATGRSSAAFRSRLRGPHTRQEPLRHLVELPQDAGAARHQHGSLERADEEGGHRDGGPLEADLATLATLLENPCQPCLVLGEELRNALAHRLGQGGDVGGQHAAQAHAPPAQHRPVQAGIPLQPLLRIVRVRFDRAQRLQEGQAIAAHQRAAEIALGGEVVVETGFLDSDREGDVGVAEGVEATHLHQALRDVEDATRSSCTAFPAHRTPRR
ncbi:MAG: putative delta-60 repeat protein [Anaerolineales bacterium]|nr:putative delta-60 repeat protein [Anaerolineales bacterium]